MEYEQFIDLDLVTLQDCLDLYNYKGMKTIILDGRIVDFIKE